MTCPEHNIAKGETEKTAKSKRKIIIIAAFAITMAIALVFLWNNTIKPLNKYNDAVELMRNGSYKEAVVVFEELDGYKDSSAQIAECESALIEIEKSEKYNDATLYMDSGENIKAAMIFGMLGDYKDSHSYSYALWEKFAQRDPISAGGNHTVCLKSDGTVVATGYNENGQCDVSGWKNIKRTCKKK